VPCPLATSDGSFAAAWLMVVHSPIDGWSTLRIDKQFVHGAQPYDSLRCSCILGADLAEGEHREIGMPSIMRSMLSYPPVTRLQLIRL
jgi:hypothetical protein